MAKWEYKIEEPPRGISSAQEILDKYSQDGWELHWQDENKEGWWTFIFKRKIED